MSEMILSLWMVTWRDRGKTSAWRVVDDGKYHINKPRRLKDETGDYWQVPVYAHNRMTAVFDAAGIINKEIQRDASVGQKRN